MLLPQNEYVVRVNGCPSWKDYKSVTFGMCMGNPNWEGAKFAATLEWASRHFDLIRIALSDTLGRYNHIMNGIKQEEALQIARKQGDAWLNDHLSYLRLCGKPYEIVRWDQWLDHPDFEDVFAQFGRLTLSGRPLSNLLDVEIKKHIERLQSRGVQVSSATHQNCFAYLLEELAGTTLRARTFGKACKVYPAPEPLWLKAVRNGEISDAPSGLEQEYYVAINLRRRKNEISLDAGSKIISAHCAA